MFDLTVNPADDCNRLGSGRPGFGRGRTDRSAGRTVQTPTTGVRQQQPVKQARVQHVDVHRRLASRPARAASSDPRADLYLEMSDLHNWPHEADLLGQRIDVWA